MTRYVAGDHCPEFISNAIRGGAPQTADSAIVEIANDGGVLLFDSDNRGLLRVEAEWSCGYDGEGQWLRINSSSIAVFVEPGGHQPVFRYEYQRDNGRNLPDAHIHFHGEHPEFVEAAGVTDLTDAMSQSGDGSRRSRKRADGTKKTRMSSLHFSVGGTRFRPCLEEILLMLIEEFGVTPRGAERHVVITELEESLAHWRRGQTAAVIRDTPSIAVQFLQEQGYSVTPPDFGPLPDHLAKLKVR